mgnify:CR=1 FL=1
MKRLCTDVAAGCMIGQFIGFWIATLFSLLDGNQWMASTPQWVSRFPNTSLATLSAAVLWCVIGVLFTVSGDYIFHGNTWSITRQTITHFLVTLLGFLPLMAVSGWFPITFCTVSGFILIFILIYLIIGLIRVYTVKRQVATLNQHLQHHNK